MAITKAVLAAAVGRICDRLEAAGDELNAQDAKIGDGDLGVTLTLCARGVRAVLDDLPDDLGAALMKCVQAITKVSGSSFATLLASSLMSAAKTVKGRNDVPWSEISVLLDGAATMIQTRGKASPGDKTVLDAVAAAAGATAGLDDPKAIAAAALKAVDDTLDVFRDRPNRAGRARIWAEKSIGLDDPGMVAFRRMVEAL